MSKYLPSLLLLLWCWQVNAYTQLPDCNGTSFLQSTKTTQSYGCAVPSGGGGGSLALQATTSNLTYYPSLAATTTSSGLSTVYSSGLSFNPSTNILNIGSGGEYEIGGNAVLYLPDSDTTSIAVGIAALANQGSTKYENAAVGASSLNNVSSGTGNIGLGYQAGGVVTSGTNNIAIGLQALDNNTGDTGNLTTGSNIAIGALAMSKAITPSASNVAIGGSALSATTSGVSNVALGNTAGSHATTGNSNVYLGAGVGSSTITSASNDILLGTSNSCDASSGSASNEFHLCGSAGDAIKITGMGTASTEVVTINGPTTFNQALSVTGNLTTNVTGGGTQCLHADNSGVVTGTGSDCGAGESSALSALTAATTGNTINNGANAQVWAWNSLTTGTALSITTTDLSSGNLESLSATSTANTGNTLLLNNSSTAGGLALKVTGNAAISSSLVIGTSTSALFGIDVVGSCTYANYGGGLGCGANRNSSNTNYTFYYGFDPNLVGGFIQSATNGVGFDPTFINPEGSNVIIGGVTTTTAKLTIDGSLGLTTTSAASPLGMYTSGANILDLSTSGTKALEISAGQVVSLTNALGVGSGGTGLATTTTNSLLLGGGGTNAMTALAATATAGWVLTATTTAPSWQAPSGGGSGTVNSGTTPDLSYYATSTTAVSDAVGLQYNATTKGLNINGVNAHSLPDNGLDTTGVSIGATALLAQTTTGLNNVGIGPAALNATTTGHDNVAIGSNAGKLIVSDSSVVAVGSGALAAEAIGNNATSGNVGVGFKAGTALTSGTGSVMIGYEAGMTSTAPSGSVIIGNLAGASELLSTNNVMVGAQAGQHSTGFNNVFVGFGAGCNGCAVAASGGRNTFFGHLTGGDVTSGANNTILGSDVDSTTLITGSFNIEIGNDNTTHAALSTTTSGIAIGTGVLIGSGDVGIGYNALHATTTNNNNSVAIGLKAGSKITSGTNNLVLGPNVASTTLATGVNNILLGTTSSCDASGSSAGNEYHLCGSGGDSEKITGMGTASTEQGTFNGHYYISSTLDVGVVGLAAAGSFQVAITGTPLTTGSGHGNIVIYDNSSLASGTGGGIEFDDFDGVSQRTAAQIWSSRENATSGNSTASLNFSTRLNGSNPATALTLNSALAATFQGAIFAPNLATSSSATTGTVCWTTGTGLINVDTTLGCLSSREDLKDIKGPIHEPLSIVLKLKPFWFSWKKTTPEYKGDTQEQPGLGANATAEVDSRLAAFDAYGEPRGVRYQEMTALLVAAMQEQQTQIADLRNQIEQLKTGKKEPSLLDKWLKPSK